MLRTVLAGLAVCFWLLGGGQPGCCAAKGPAAKAFDAAAERIGELRLGLAAEGVATVVPCRPEKSREIYEGATGDSVQTWKMPGCGLELKMSGQHKGGKKTVAAITVTAPSELATSLGIRVGATEAEVVSAYGRYRDKDGVSKRGRTFVAGSIYDGLIFDFKNGRVTRMFLGAAAE